MLLWATRGEKNNQFFSFWFFFWKSQEKISFFDLFTVKLCIIIRNLPGNYLNLIRNQDQEITLRAPGIRVCLARGALTTSSSRLVVWSKALPKFTSNKGFNRTRPRWTAARLSIKPRKTRIKFQLKVLLKSNKSLSKYLFVNFV